MGLHVLQQLGPPQGAIKYVIMVLLIHGLDGYQCILLTQCVQFHGPAED